MDYIQCNKCEKWKLEKFFICKWRICTKCIEEFKKSKIIERDVIHHINGCHHDNRPENLLICISSYHRYLHVQYKDIYKKITIKYGENGKELARNIFIN